MAQPYTPVTRPGPHPDKVRGLGGRGSIRIAVRPCRDGLTRTARPLSGVPVSRHHRICVSWLRQPAHPPRPSARAFRHGPHAQRLACHDDTRRHGRVAPRRNSANRRYRKAAVARLRSHSDAGCMDRGPQPTGCERNSYRHMNLLSASASLAGRAGFDHTPRCVWLWLVGRAGRRLAMSGPDQLPYRYSPLR
jgi:hypothetical protein